MQLSFLVLFLISFCSTMSFARTTDVQKSQLTIVRVPHMKRQTQHPEYLHKLLELALSRTEATYGPYRIQHQDTETLQERQLRGLETGEDVSVTYSNAKARWDNVAIRVPFPLMKGLGSVRFFFTLRKNLPALKNVNSLKDFYQFSQGQGLGWSTAIILERNNFRVVYGSRYEGMFDMLEADRFDLLMRSAFELLGEKVHLSTEHPSITYDPNTAMLTFLPMYFYVSNTQPELATRLEQGLKSAYESGDFDKLFRHYFKEASQLALSPSVRTHWINNVNVTTEQFYEAKPYLLPALANNIEQNLAPKS